MYRHGDHNVFFVFMNNSTYNDISPTSLYILTRLFLALLLFYASICFLLSYHIIEGCVNGRKEKREVGVIPSHLYEFLFLN